MSTLRSDALRAAPRQATEEDTGVALAWRWLLARAGRLPPECPIQPRVVGLGPAADLLLELYRPLVERRDIVVAHLGQSLDGRIATESGTSQWVTGPEDIRHTHRLRALCDAVLVGAGTVAHDDPQLTVREVEGCNPVRVVLDARRRLAGRSGVFRDGAARTLVICAADTPRSARGQGAAECVPVAAGPDGLDLAAALEQLRALGLRRIFVEGGGVTVSRFLAAGLLDRLQVTVAPLLIGSGRPSFVLPKVERLDGCLRPETRVFRLGDDVLFDCALDG